MAKAFERAGIPTVIVTTLPTIAAMVGAHRIVRGVAITHPFGDPGRAREAERALRRRIVERALAMLATGVSASTIWEATP
jgi:glycine/betaine/sarcosine/D-proline reductase family selenoprotein B